VQTKQQKNAPSAPTARSASEPHVRYTPNLVSRLRQKQPHSADAAVDRLPAYFYPASAVKPWNAKSFRVGDGDDSEDDDDDYEKIDESRIESTITHSNAMSPRTDDIASAKERPSHNPCTTSKDESSSDDDGAYDDCLSVACTAARGPTAEQAAKAPATTCNAKRLAQLQAKFLAIPKMGRRFKIQMDMDSNFSCMMVADADISPQMPQQQAAAGGERARDDCQRQKILSPSKIFLGPLNCVDGSSIGSSSSGGKSNSKISNDRRNKRCAPVIRPRVQSPEPAGRSRTTVAAWRNEDASLSSPPSRWGMCDELQAWGKKSSSDALLLESRLHNLRVESSAARVSRRDCIDNSPHQRGDAAPKPGRSRSHDLLREQRPEPEIASGRKSVDVLESVKTKAHTPLAQRHRPPPPPPLTAFVMPRRRSGCDAREDDHDRDDADMIWKEWKSPSDIPSDADFCSFGVEQLAHCVELLGIPGQLGGAFRQQNIDGEMLVDWLKNSSATLLESFGCRQFDICKLYIFVLDGWRPKVKNVVE
jgi:hypothetical protein